MKRFIFEERNGIYIIDLAKTVQQIRNAVEVVREIIASENRFSLSEQKNKQKSLSENAQKLRRILCVRKMVRRNA